MNIKIGLIQANNLVSGTLFSPASNALPGKFCQGIAAKPAIVYPFLDHTLSPLLCLSFVLQATAHHRLDLSDPGMGPYPPRVNLFQIPGIGLITDLFSQ